MSRFDNWFAEQVKLAFGSYNANHLANEGWNAFKKKQAEAHRYAIIFPFWAKAASVALLLAGSGMVAYLLTGPSKELQQTEALSPGSRSEEVINSIVIKPSQALKGSIQPKPVEIQRRKSSYVAPEKPEGFASLAPALNNQEASVPAVAADTVRAVLAVSADKEAMASGVRPEVPSSVAANPAGLWSAPNSEEPKKQPKNHYSLGLSGMMAKLGELYSTAPGVAVGFYAQHSLGSRVSVRPGLALARHTYNMESSTGNNLDASSVVVANTAATDISKNEMDMVTLEVPINFVLELFRGQQGKLFVSAGASSIFYLSQQFAGTYRNGVTREVFNSQTGQYEELVTYLTIEVENRYKAFSHTDLFGLANFSAGYSFPFGKSSMLIEPFVQIPLRKLTSNNLSIGFGGISVKYRLPL